MSASKRREETVMIFDEKRYGKVIRITKERERDS